MMIFQSFPTLETTDSERDLARQYEATGEALLAEFSDTKNSQNTLPQAINAFMQAAELNDSPSIQAKLSRAYMLNGQLSVAETMIAKVASRSDLDQASYCMLLENMAFIHTQREEFEAARDYLIQAVASQTNDKLFHAHIGLAANWIEEAQRTQRKMPWLTIGKHVVKGLCFLPFASEKVFVKESMVIPFVTQMGQWLYGPQLMSRLVSLSHEYPGSSHLLVAIGREYMANEQYTEAEFAFKRAIERFPMFDEAYKMLVSVYQATRNLDGALQILKAWEQIRPNNGAIQLQLSRVMSEEPTMVEDALRMAKQAVLTLTDNIQLAEAYFHIGNIYTAMAQPQAASVAYQTSISLVPNCLEAYIHVGTLYYDLQDYKLSELMFEKALSLDSTNAKIYCNLGYLAWMQNDIKKAQQFYHVSISLDPTYDIALNNLGVLYLDHIGDINQAMALFGQTLQVNPNYALCHYNVGRAYSFLGENIEAARSLQRAQELNVHSQELDNQELKERINQLFEND